jgi:N-acetylneuraminic acid mutarotase
LLDDGRVLLVGGDYFEGSTAYPNNSAELIDPSRAAALSTLLFSLAWQTATKLPDGRVLVTGGGLYKSDTTCKTSVPTEVFDPRTERLTAVGPMSTRLSGSAAIGIADGRVLFFGGVVDSDCEAVGTVEAFDPDSGTFQVIATGFPALTGFSATLLNDGRILVAGGDNGDWNGMTAVSWLLKP